MRILTCFRGPLAEVFPQAQCFLAQHVAVNWNTFSVPLSRPQIRGLSSSTKHLPRTLAIMFADCARKTRKNFFSFTIHRRFVLTKRSPGLFPFLIRSGTPSHLFPLRKHVLAAPLPSCQQPSLLWAIAKHSQGDLNAGRWCRRLRPGGSQCRRRGCWAKGRFPARAQQ